MARLVTTRFRCYATARLDLDRRPVVLTGPNGAGKTNLLEAVSLLGPGRGLRRARLPDIDRLGDDGGWGVAAIVQTPGGTVEIGTGREPGGERRTIQIDGKAARGQSALAEHVSVLWLTPEMDRLFREGSYGRRRFLDRLVYGFDPAHAGRVAAYEQAMRDRSRLLQEGTADGTWLSVLEDDMAARGVAISAARLDMVRRLDRALATSDGTFPGVALAVTGTVEDWLAEIPALAAEDRLKEALRANRRLDAQTGTTAAGPHRSDLEAWHLPRKMPADRCSTGEQKAMLIAIVLAEARLQSVERGVAPLLLLDEVAAHLDEDRRAALFDEICELPGQTWMSGTDEALFEALGRRAQRYAVADAAVRRMY
ncbi:MAG: DNA replication/repair protein RecF [Rhodospirillales bacterium]|nr:MAG: DNA replication/repair protein RecF [Rhodospirillales bacterium]